MNENSPATAPLQTDCQLSRKPWVIYHWLALYLGLAILAFVLLQDFHQIAVSAWFLFCLGLVVLVDPSLTYEIRNQQIWKNSLFLPWTKKHWPLSQITGYHFVQKPFYGPCLTLHFQDGSRLTLRGLESNSFLDWCRKFVPERKGED